MLLHGQRGKAPQIAKHAIICYFIRWKQIDSVLGDEMQSSFSEIYIKYHKIMLYVAYKVSGNQEQAEDAVQNAFIKMLKDPERILRIPTDELRPYLIVVSENAARSILRQRKYIDDRPLEETDFPEEQNPEDIALSRINGSNLFTMPELPPQFRDVIILKYYYDMDTRTIAQTLDISESNVRARLLRARNLLRKMLECEG